MLRGIVTDAQAHEREDARIQREMTEPRIAMHVRSIEEELIDTAHKLENILAHVPLQPVKWRSEEEHAFGIRLDRYKREDAKHRENLARKRRRMSALEEERHRLQEHGLNMTNSEDVTVEDLVKFAASYIDVWKRSHPHAHDQKKKQPANGAVSSERPERKKKRKQSRTNGTNGTSSRIEAILTSGDDCEEPAELLPKERYAYLLRGQLPQEARKPYEGSVLSGTGALSCELNTGNVLKHDRMMAEHEGASLLSHMKQQNTVELIARVRGMVLKLSEKLRGNDPATLTEATERQDFLIEVALLEWLEQELRRMERVEMQARTIIDQYGTVMMRDMVTNIAGAISFAARGKMLDAMRCALETKITAHEMKERHKHSEKARNFFLYTHAVHLLLCTRKHISERDEEARKTFLAAKSALGMMVLNGSAECEEAHRAVKQAFAETKSLLTGGLSR